MKSKKLKATFSPWVTKQESYIDDSLNVEVSEQHHINSQKYKEDCYKSPKKARRQEYDSIKSIQRSQSKGEHTNEAINEDQKTISTKRAHTSNHKYHSSGGRFDTERWKMLTINSRQRFKSEYAKIKNDKNQMVENILEKRKRKSLGQLNTDYGNQNFSEKPLQQISIRNFIIHGHYSDKYSGIFPLNIQSSSKRKQTTYLMKQKFAELKKTINVNDFKENDPHRKLIQIKGKQKENLFRVIKLEREINKVL